MQRRESLCLPGALAIGGLAPDELFALGTGVHIRLREPRAYAPGRMLDAHGLATLEAALPREL